MQTAILAEPETKTFDLWAKQADTDWTLIGMYKQLTVAQQIEKEMLEVDKMVNEKGLQVN